MPVARVNGVDLQYRVEGAGPPVLLVIGFGEDHSAWSAVATRLAERFTVVAFDNRSSGRSTYVAGFTIEDLAADAVGLADLVGFDRFGVVGQSMGGAIALTVARLHPARVDRLVVLNSFAALDRATLAAFDAFGTLMAQGTEVETVVRCLVPWMHAEAFLSTPERVAARVEEMLAAPHPQALEGYWHQLDALRAFDATGHLGEIAAPTLVVAGAEDRVAPLRSSRQIAEGVPGARLVVLPTGHVAHHEEPDLVAATVAFHLTGSRADEVG